MILLKASVVAILLQLLMLFLSTASSSSVSSSSSSHRNEIVAWSDVYDYPQTFATDPIRVSDPSKLQYVQVNTQAILHEVKRQLGMTTTTMTSTAAGQVNNSFLRTPSTSSKIDNHDEKISTLVVFPLPTVGGGRRITCEFTKSYNMPTSLQDKFPTLIETEGRCAGGVAVSFVFLLRNNDDGDDVGGTSITMSGTFYLPNDVTLYMDPIKETTSTTASKITNIYALYDRSFAVHDDGSKLLPTEYILPGVANRTIILNFPMLCDVEEFTKVTTIQEEEEEEQQHYLLKVALVATDSFSNLFTNGIQNRGTTTTTAGTMSETNNKAVVLMSMITLLERMGGYYRNELGISFQLISNNDKLICSDGAASRSTTTGNALSNDTNEPFGCGEVLQSSLSLKDYDEYSNYIIDAQVETFLRSNGVNAMEYDVGQALMLTTDTSSSSSGIGATVVRVVGRHFCKNDSKLVSRRLNSHPTIAPSVSMVVASTAPSVSMVPTLQPTKVASTAPSVSMVPTLQPTKVASTAPSVSMVPTLQPTKVASTAPSVSMVPTLQPTKVASTAPSVSMVPTLQPTKVASTAPSVSMVPTLVPTLQPTKVPSTAPSVSMVPTLQPTTTAPSVSMVPTLQPTKVASTSPSDSTLSPTKSSSPSSLPSKTPTSAPSCSMAPSSSPTITSGKGGKGGIGGKGGSKNECNGGGNAPRKSSKRKMKNNVKKTKNNVTSSGSRE